MHQADELRACDLVLLRPDDDPHTVLAVSLRVLDDFLRELRRAKRFLAAIVCPAMRVIC